MRRFARRLFTLVSATSLALAVLVCLAWVVSRFRTDAVGYVGWDDRAAETWQGVGLTSHGGRVAAYRFTSGTIRFDDSPHNLSGIHVPGMQPHFFHHGYVSYPANAEPQFMFRHVSLPGSPLHFYFVGVPHALLVLLLALAGAPAGLRLLTRIRRRLRPLPGHCRACGYDLRASPDRCPECGTHAAAMPNA